MDAQRGTSADPSGATAKPTMYRLPLLKTVQVPGAGRDPRAVLARRMLTCAWQSDTAATRACNNAVRVSSIMRPAGTAWSMTAGGGRPANCSDDSHTAAVPGRAGRLPSPLMLALQRRLRRRVVLGALDRAVRARSASMRAQKVVELSSHQPVQLAGPAGRDGGVTCCEEVT